MIQRLFWNVQLSTNLFVMEALYGMVKLHPTNAVTMLH
jgi:hypothetical protein